MKLYKLTNQDMTTYNGMVWALNEPKNLPPVADPQLCTGQVLHTYTCPLLALLLNPMHADIDSPRLFEAEGTPVVNEWDKCGTFSLILINELPLPDWWIDTNKRKQAQIKFAILCAEAVLSVFEGRYPSDERPRKAIEAAKEYLLRPSSNAARSAAYAADAAADAAYAAAYAADAATRAADAAYAAADAARAAYAAARAAVLIDFSSIAQEAIK